jgi:thiamine-monophosphate kinase
MGATPAWALLALTLPKADMAFVEGFAAGFAQLAQSCRLALVGGDITRGALTISVAVHGFVPPGKALTRAGAQVGDAVLVTGTLGDAAGGLQLLQQKQGREEAHTAYLLERFQRPVPRVAAGFALREHANACIDVSDGLLADLGHLCKASGVGAEIEVALLPHSPALLHLFGEAASREFALSGGEDYELCFTVPFHRLAAVSAALTELGCAATRIGRIVEGEGIAVRGREGQPLTSSNRGWDHFSP